MKQRSVRACVTAIATVLFMLTDAKSMGKDEVYVLVKQHTDVGRIKREVGYDAVFPTEMTFTVAFEDKDVSLHLLKNLHMASHPPLYDSNGERSLDLERNIGLYQDADKLASMIVQCEGTLDTCTLQGSLMVDGSIWKISPDEQTAETMLHRARRHQMSAEFIENSDKKTVRKRREVPNVIPDCDIIEIFAFVDQSEWNFWLDWKQQNETEAELAIIRYYMGVYLENLAVDWTASADVPCINNPLALDSPECIDGTTGIGNCGALQAVLRPNLPPFDYAQCFSRKDIILNNDQDVTSVGYNSVICNAALEFQASIIESANIWKGLSVAHQAANGLGSSFDGDTAECSDDDYFIMRTRYQDNAPDLEKCYNKWLFSNCSLMSMWTYINALGSNCLRQHDFNTFDWVAQQNVPDLGTLYGLDDQCKLRYGLDSVACDSTGQGKEFAENMCLKGISCTAGGHCNGTVGVFTGTQCSRWPKKVCIKGSCCPTEPEQYCPPCNCCNTNDWTGY